MQKNWALISGAKETYLFFSFLLPSQPKSGKGHLTKERKGSIAKCIRKLSRDENVGEASNFFLWRFSIFFFFKGKIELKNNKGSAHPPGPPNTSLGSGGKNSGTFKVHNTQNVPNPLTRNQVMFFSSFIFVLGFHGEAFTMTHSTVLGRVKRGGKGVVCSHTEAQ